MKLNGSQGGVLPPAKHDTKPRTVPFLSNMFSDTDAVDLHLLFHSSHYNDNGFLVMYWFEPNYETMRITTFMIKQQLAKMGFQITNIQSDERIDANDKPFTLMESITTNIPEAVGEQMTRAYSRWIGDIYTELE